MVSEIVVNSLLWYAHEQMKQISKEKLVKFILNFHSENAIEEAKNVIFDDFPEEDRPRKLLKKVQTQGLNNAESDFKDIIEVFHEIAVVKGFKPTIFVTAD